MWEPTVEFLDERKEIDPNVYEIKQLRNGIKQGENVNVITEFDAITNTYIVKRIHAINYFGYIYFDNDFRNQIKEFNAVRRYTSREQAISENLQKLTELYSINGLGEPEEKYDHYRYNLLLADYSRQRCGYSVPVNSLAYLDDQDITSFFSNLGEDYAFKLKIRQNNLMELNNETITLNFYPNASFDRVLQISDGLTSTHISWHYDIVHTFSYATIKDMETHFYDKLLEDIQLVEKLSSGARVRMFRFSERLSPIGNMPASSMLRKIIALGTVVKSLSEAGENKFSIRDIDRLHTICSNLPDVQKDQYLAGYHYPLKFYIFSELIPFQIAIGYSTIKLTGYMNKINFDLTIGSSNTPMHFASNLSFGNEKQFRTVTNMKMSQSNFVRSVLNDYTYPSGVLLGHIKIEANSLERATEDEIGISQGGVKSQLIARMNNNVRISDYVVQNVQQRYEQFKNSSEFDIGSINHLLYCCIFNNRNDFVKTRNDTIVVDVNLPLRNFSNSRMNNSTMKMISVYCKLAYDSLSEKPYLLKPNDRLYFVGTEKEPAVSILRQFNRSVNNVAIRGIGERGESPNWRGTFPLALDTNITSDYLISDIDQHMDTYDHGLYMEKIKMLIQSCVSISPKSMIKVNFMSQQIANDIVDYIKAHYTNYNLEIFRFGAQNIFNDECFLYIYRTADKTIRYFDNDELFKQCVSSYDSVVTDGNVVEQSFNVIRPPLAMNAEHTHLMGVVKIENVDDILSQVSNFCNVVVTGALTENYIAYFGKVNSTRRHLAKRAVGYKTGQFKKYVPNGFGVLSRKYQLNDYTVINTVTVYKMMVYRTISLIVQDLTDIVECVSIGGRNLADVECVPYTMPFKIIDPNTREDPSNDIFEALDIIVDRSNFEFGNVIFENNKIYLVLFVIMTDSKGVPVSEVTQLQYLRNLVEAIANTENSHLFVTFYDKDATKKLNPKDEMFQGISELLYDSGKLSVGRYAAVDPLDVKDVTAILDDYDVTHDYLVLSESSKAELLDEIRVVPTPEYNLLRYILPELMPILYVTSS